MISAATAKKNELADLSELERFKEQRTNRAMPIKEWNGFGFLEYSKIGFILSLEISTIADCKLSHLATCDWISNGSLHFPCKTHVGMIHLNGNGTITCTLQRWDLIRPKFLT